MSIFSIIGLAILIIVAATGITLKIIMNNWRKKLDGTQGYLEQEDKRNHRDDPTEDWESL